MKIEEHSKIMQAQVVFYHSTIDVMRRELVTYKALIRNLTDKTKDQRGVVSAIAAYVRKYIEHHQPCCLTTIEQNKHAVKCAQQFKLPRLRRR